MDIWIIIRVALALILGSWLGAAFGTAKAINVLRQEKEWRDYLDNRDDFLERRKRVLKGESEVDDVS